MQLKTKILLNNQVSPGYYSMAIQASDIAAQAVPGQFLHVKAADGYYPLLRRPLSLHEIDREKGIIGLLYQVRGTGTEFLSKKVAEEEIDLIGPLGKGFSLDFTGDNAVIIAGGIGTAPLYPLAKELITAGKKVAVLLGAKSADGILTAEKFQSLGCDVAIATEDGSRGQKGYVTEIFKEYILKGTVHCLYACGPEAMLVEVERICLKNRISGEVSLEAYMGCGVGACLSCACERRKTGSKKYAKVCKDGPVFPIGGENI